MPQLWFEWLQDAFLVGGSEGRAGVSAGQSRFKFERLGARIQSLKTRVAHLASEGDFSIRNIDTISHCIHGAEGPGHLARRNLNRFAGWAGPRQ